VQVDGADVNSDPDRLVNLITSQYSSSSKSLVQLKVLSKPPSTPHPTAPI